MVSKVKREKIRRILICVITTAFLVITLTYVIKNYFVKLDNIYNSTAIRCYSNTTECIKDAKRNVMKSTEGRNLIVFTGVSSLLILNMCAFVFYEGVYKKHK